MFMDLLNRNPENHAYYRGLEKAMQAGEQYLLVFSPPKFRTFF